MAHQATPAAYRCGDYTIIPAERRLLRAGEPLELEAKVFDLIVMLIENRDRALDKRTLAEALWGRRPVTDTALSQLVYKARRAFDDDGERQATIRTVYGRGLQWAAPTECLAAEPATAEPAVPVAEPAPTASAGAAPARRPARRARWLAAVGVLVLAAAVAALLALLSRQAPAPPLRLAMLPVENATGDASLDWVRNGLPGLIGSLIGETGAVDVGDALQTARAANFAPVGDASPQDRLRHATGATVVVGGRLRRIGENLYELALQVDGGGAAAHGDRLVVSATDVATLGVNAAPRILRLLGLQPPPARPESGPHGEDYFAQTFARGLDLAAQGDWTRAKPYFALCVQNAPDFLPAQLRLGEAEANTRDLARSDATLARLAEAAAQHEMPSLQAAALLALAENQFRRGDRRAALALIDRARGPAEQGADPEVRARLHLMAAQALAILERAPESAQDLRRGRELIERYGLRQRLAYLAHTEGLIAETRRDFPAQQAAAHRALAAAEALGDERTAIGQTYLLGRMLSWQERPFEALPLLVRAWQRAREAQMLHTQVVSGVEMAWVLAETGLYAEACAVTGTVLAALHDQSNRYWKAVATAADARCRRAGGDAAAGLAGYRAAWPLVDPREDPQLAALVLRYQALAAFVAEPAALPAIRTHLAQVATETDPAVFLHAGRLVDALAAAAAGERAAALAALEAERDDPDRDDPQRNEFNRVALRIAIAGGDPAVAALVTAGFDPDANNDAEVLRLFAEWSAAHGQGTAAERARARRADLERRAREALAAIEFTLPPPDTGPDGSGR
ncbi:winged helix-turn-helix domain-containing protein [Dokdonella koreensis]|uniref:Transcriptional regulator, CadC family n=1 Tax=Dokdonella koreensis DS-123 TaxID=1300342 RepID=A0A160DZ85_9GAMM|nr:winged helix-turn-helix domain-containing protein [Dokdonella koreensis]ANB19493.1 Transcriptional regulator, CadC family [Dokdonella koreensis DS-123]